MQRNFILAELDVLRSVQTLVGVLGLDSHSVVAGNAQTEDNVDYFHPNVVDIDERVARVVGVGDEGDVEIEGDAEEEHGRRKNASIRRREERAHEGDDAQNDGDADGGDIHLAETLLALE